LRYVPVSALYDGKRYLVERYECSLIGIATAPRTSVAAHGSCAFGVSQAASVPVPGGDAVIAFPALPDVQKETALVRSGDGRRATRLIDGEFTWAHARAAIGRKPSTVHFATHFRLSPDNAAESYLLLGDKSVQSVAALSRQADLFAGVRNLTLSACETANLGDGKDADGLAGVCQRLGAQNVVATLWPTEDPASLTFMEKYYKMASGPTPAARLRQAQLGIMRENASSPRFWAAFVVTVTKNE
jgi:CHAT domain-containing protein